MPQERKPPALLDLINQNAEGIIGAAGMVAGGPGGAGKKVALKAAPKVAKKVASKIPQIRSSADLNKIPAELFEQFVKHNETMAPNPGILGSNLEEIIQGLWQAFAKTLK